MKRPFASVVAGLRTARLIGLADRRRRSGDLVGANADYAAALALLESPRFDLEFVLFRSAAPIVLFGYASTAVDLGRRAEAIACLRRWRPRCLEWASAPLTPEEGEYYRWFEQYLSWADGTGR